MVNKTEIFSSSPISIASHDNYKEAVFLISVLDQPDRINRIIPVESGKKYHKTIIGYPLVAKLKKATSDFGGHEMKITKTKKGKKFSFDTFPIGSITDSWIEEREVDGYDGKQKCILAKTKLWTSRFPEYFKVFDKLWDDGELSSSWEMTVTDSEKDGDCTILKVFEFIGNACLGRLKTPCVPGAGVIEYAELEKDIDTELAEALEKDLVNLDIEENDVKEDIGLAENTKKKIENEETEDTKTSVKETDDKEKKTEETASCGSDSTKKKTKVAEETKEISEENAEVTEIASLTQWDLESKIRKACDEKIGKRVYGYVAFWFPEDNTVWYKTDDSENQLDYKLFTYEVSGDEVFVSEPVDVKLTVAVKDVNMEIASKDEEIGNLKAELDIKNDAVINAGKTINTLKTKIAELEPFKEKVEKAEQEKIEAEIAEEKDALRCKMLKGNLFTESEIAETEIAELIESRNVSEINNLIAERYIERIDNAAAEVAEFEKASNEESVATASLETDDIADDSVSFMSKFLNGRKHN